MNMNRERTSILTMRSGDRGKRRASRSSTDSWRIGTWTRVAWLRGFLPNPDTNQHQHLLSDHSMYIRALLRLLHYALYLLKNFRLSKKICKSTEEQRRSHSLSSPLSVWSLPVLLVSAPTTLARSPRFLSDQSLLKSPSKGGRSLLSSLIPSPPQSTLPHCEVIKIIGVTVKTFVKGYQEDTIHVFLWDDVVCETYDHRYQYYSTPPQLIPKLTQQQTSLLQLPASSFYKSI